MQPCYHQDVVSRRFLKRQHHTGIHKTAVPEQHRPGHRSALRMPCKKRIQPRQQISTRARQTLRNVRGRPFNQLQQFAAPQRANHINFLARQKFLHIKCPRIQIISRRPRLHQNLYAIPSPQFRRRFRNPRPRIKIHAQPARSAQRRARRFHLLQINFESFSPREPQRIFAQSPAPAQRDASIHAPRRDQSRDMIRRNRIAFHASSQPANRRPRDQRKTPGHCRAMPPGHESSNQNAAEQNPRSRTHRPQSRRPRPSLRNPDARRKRSQYPQCR